MPRFVGRAAPFLDRLNTYGADGWTGGGPVLDYSPRWPIDSSSCWAIMFLRLLTCGVVCAVDGVRVGAVGGYRCRWLLRLTQGPIADRYSAPARLTDHENSHQT